MTHDDAYWHGIGRRAIAARGWAWRAGAVGGDRAGAFFRIVHVHPIGGAFVVSGAAVLPVSAAALAAMVPDFRDPATRGVLLALVREARGAPRALVRLSADGVSFHVFDVDRVGPLTGSWRGWLSNDATTEAEALVLALEAP